jgi:hypothetical protein
MRQNNIKSLDPLAGTALCITRPAFVDGGSTSIMVALKAHGGIVIFSSARLVGRTHDGRIIGGARKREGIL